MRGLTHYPELGLALVAPSAAAAERRDQLLEPVRSGLRSPAESAELIRRNRATLLAEHALRPLAADDESARLLLAEVAPLAEKVRGRLRDVDAAVALLERLAIELGIAVRGMKGLAGRIGYPDPALRELRDADVFVGTADEAFALARALREHGYCTDRFELPWLKADRAGELYGQYKLTGPDGLASVDVHFGPGYSTGHCGLLPVPTPEGAGYGLLDQVCNARPMLGNSGGDLHLTVKDLNDLWVLAGSLSTSEAAALAVDARRAGLRGHLATVARAVLAHLRVDEPRRAVLSSWARSRILLPPPVAGRRLSRFERVARTSLRSLRQAAAHTRNPLAVALVPAGAAAYYSANLALRTTAGRVRVGAPRPWRCVRLVPLPLATALLGDAADPVREWDGDARAGADRAGAEPAAARSAEPVTGLRRAGTTYEAGNDTFLPTVWYRLPAGEIRAAARHRAEEATRA